MSALESSKPKQARQAAAIPFRQRSQKIEFCLVKSSSGRWIFPKGSINSKYDYAETALNEAFEEAGLHGQIIGKPLGYYNIEKESGSFYVVAVLMKVSKADPSWKEDSWRERRWASPKDAFKLFAEKIYHDLVDLAIERIENQ